MKVNKGDFMIREDQTGKLAWFFAGAAIGAAIALLYAPASGEETRERIGQKAREHADKLQEHGETVAEKGRELYERGKSLADEAADVFDRGKRMVQG